jgi:tellurite resistance protein TehA-like permease
MKIMLDERNLAKQSLFWAAIILPVILFFGFGAPLWENLNFEFSKEAYNKFLDINKFPLYLFGTCVPFVAIVAYMHRTIQTEKQINHTKKTNRIN